LGLVKIVIEGVTVVKFGMDYGSGDGGGSFVLLKSMKGGSSVTFGSSVDKLGFSCEGRGLIHALAMATGQADEFGLRHDS
jgi:hypothetical protein